MKEKMLISFSGGRTSGYMTKMLIDNYSDKYEFVVVFANTGFENEATLEFVNNCDRHFGFNTVWLEAVVHSEMGVGITHEVVNFETASRNGEPFEEVIKKYGLPNISAPHCTKNLKLFPIHSYMKSIGWKKQSSYLTALGIRTDESRRATEKPGRKVVYPLIDWFPSDKQDILDWWEDQPFDLNLQEHQGNCKTCYKKSFKKLIRLHQEDSSQFDFFERMEKEYGTVGAEFKGKQVDPLPRVFFRNRTSVTMLREMAKNTDSLSPIQKINMYEDGGCSESCELYETE